MNPSIYLPIAGVSVPVLLLVGLGLAVGFVSGLFGVGGGFLITPLLIMIGIPPTVAAASDSTQIVAATTSGTLAHWRRGNVDFKMGLFLLIGGIVGGTLGVQLIKMLRSAGEADFVIKITYIVLLSGIGGYMFMESFHSLKTAKRPATIAAGTANGLAGAGENAAWIFRVCRALPFQAKFEKSGINLSVLAPLILGAMVGILSAIMGIGGGFIMVPMMVYVLRLPMHLAVGTNLFQEVFICLNVAFMQAYYNQTVDIVLALILLSGSTVGAQLGARISDRLKADQLKIILATIILLVMLQMTIALILRPELLLSIARRHF
jgi:uncharacterized membrane protein YfcA